LHVLCHQSSPVNSLFSIRIARLIPGTVSGWVAK
jgi:hypothetical protein